MTYLLKSLSLGQSDFRSLNLQHQFHYHSQLDLRQLTRGALDNGPAEFAISFAPLTAFAYEYELPGIFERE